MTAPSGNPFVFPGMGLGQSTDPMAGNPIMQSLEMMRRAWSGGMGNAQSMAGGLPTPLILNAEELERRIQELQAVENWLRLNLNMLQGSIQALEVQRATIATLRSFANMGAGAAQAAGDAAPSPLEVALGMKTGRGAEPAPSAEAPSTPAPGAAAPEAAATGDQAGPSPQQAWWNMLQNQFNQIASAAAASLPPEKPAASSADPAASTPRAKPAARATPQKRAGKSAPRKTPSRKS